MELAASASAPCPQATPFEPRCGDVGARQLQASDVAAFAPQRPANSASTTVSRSCVLVPRLPPAPPSPPLGVPHVIAEVVDVLYSVLMDITVLQQEINQIATDMQQLKDQKYAKENRRPEKGVHVSLEDYQVHERCWKQRKLDQ